MKIKYFTLLLCIGLIISACGDDSNSQSTTSQDGDVLEENEQGPATEEEAEKVSPEIIQQLEERKETKKTSPHYDANWKSSDKYINKNEGEVARVNAHGDLNNEAAQQIVLQRGDVCGTSDCGKVVIIENLNIEKRIEALVELRWKEDGKKMKDKRVYFVPPTAKLEIGCSAICKETKNIKVNWKIIGARFDT